MKFILHLLYFEQLLIPLSKLSLAWQYDSSEAPHFFAALDAMKKTLSLMKSNDKPGAVGGDLAKLLEVNDEQESAEFRGFALKNVKRGRQHFLSNYVKYIEALETKCSARFNMANETVFRASSLLDIRLWPTDQEKLAEYCNDEIDLVTTHFNALLLVEDSTRVSIKTEWLTMKLFVNKNKSLCETSEPGKTWQILQKHYSDKFPNILRVISILRVYPFSNALVERCFSTMGKIKTDWRSSLSTSTLEMLIRVKKCAPNISDF